MGCVSSHFLNQDDDFTQINTSAFNHHIVSLTSTTYGLLTLDPSSSPTTVPPTPPPRFTLASILPTPRSDPRSDPQPEIINSWDLMAGLDPTTDTHQENLNPTKENSNPNHKNPIFTKPISSKPVFLNGFEPICPPNGENKIVIYTTSLRGVRRTFEDCNAVRAVIEGFGVFFCERDVSMDRGFRDELWELMKGKDKQELVPPRVFVKGRYVGGVDEVLKIVEDGFFGQLVEGLPKSKPGFVCEVCGGVRFLPCLTCNGSCKMVMVLKDEMMEEHNVEPDHVTCSIMITVMRKTGNSAKEAWDFFETLNVRGLKWSLEVMGSLIKSFCDEGLKKEALIIQLEMEKKGIASNAIIYNTIMNAYSKSNQIEEAEGLFAEMKAKGIEPTTASYNILMDAYSRRMQPEVIEKLMVEMEEIGLQPDVKSFTCLISAYGRQKKMSDMAADAFLKMKKFGIKPTSHSYTALIHAYSISGWHEKAEFAYESMKRDGVKPSIETYTALLDAFRRAGDTESLMRIWKTMMNDKVKGTRVTFNILVDGFAKQGQYSEARDVICEFGKIGLKPTVMTYNMLINAYARGGHESKLPQLLKEMAVLELKPDSITYSTMIYAYVRVRDFKRAFYYHKQMVKRGQVPDARSYHKLRAILDVKAATKNKKDKSAIMGIISNKLGWVKIKKKGKKDEFWKNKKKWSGARSSDSVGRR